MEIGGEWALGREKKDGGRRIRLGGSSGCSFGGRKSGWKAKRDETGREVGGKRDGSGDDCGKSGGNWRDVGVWACRGMGVRMASREGVTFCNICNIASWGTKARRHGGRN